MKSWCITDADLHDLSPLGDSCVSPSHTIPQGSKGILL